MAIIVKAIIIKNSKGNIYRDSFFVMRFTKILNNINIKN